MNNLEGQIYTLLEELGFEKTIVGGQVVYKYGQSYYKISYIKSFESFVIEYAENYEEAVLNIFYDGDLYPTTLGDDLIEKLRLDLIKYYMNDDSVIPANNQS